MKFKFVFLVYVAVLQCNAQTDILKFNCSETQQIRQGLLILQPFTMPDDNDYYITEIGTQIGELSQSGKVYLGIYEYKASPSGGLYLIFRSKEISFEGGAETIITTPIKKGVQKLEASKTYYLALMYMGDNYLYVKTQNGASNEGVAVNLENTQFKNNNSYPFFPDPVSIEGNWGFNTGMVLKGEVVTEEITPYNDIFDFNTTNYQDISAGHVASSILTVSGAEDLNVRHIGIKTDTSSVSGTVKFAVYDGVDPFDIIYISDELTVPSNARDTFYVDVPESALTLHGGKSYYLAIQYGGSGALHIGKSVNPTSTGITTAGVYSYFMTETNYPVFPNQFAASGSWFFTLGFVLNSDPSVMTSIQRIERNSIKLFPVPADNFVWLRTDMPITPGTGINIYNLTGTLVLKSEWKDAYSANINVSGLPKGVYIINSSNMNVKLIKQ